MTTHYGKARVFLGVVFLAALGGVACAAGTADAGAGAGAVTDLVFLTNFDRGAKPLKDGGDRIIAEMNRRLGINLVVKPVPGAHLGGWDKINVVMASGDFPDVVVGEYPSSSNRQWIKEGILIPLNPYLEGMKTTREKIVGSYSWTAVDGKYYGYPFIEQVTNNHFYYRRDILDGLGIAPPRTLEEFHRACKVAAAAHKGTYGLTGASFHFVFGAYGLPNADYALDRSGKVVPIFEHPAFKPSMEYIRRLWQEQLLDPEFMLQSVQKIEAMFANGQVVFMAGRPLFRYLVTVEKMLKSVNPKGILEFSDPPAGPEGKRGLGTLPKKGIMTSITTKAKDPKKAALFIEFLLSPEGRELLELGIEGVHYTRRGDQIAYNEAERAADNFSPEGWAHPLAWGHVMWPITSMYLPYTTPGRDRAIESVKVANRNVIPNLVPTVPDAELELGGIVGEIYAQYLMDMLTGKLEIDRGIRELSAKWRQQGGDKILSEVAQIHASLKK